jgi:thiamine pyrophosphate-dependent acetolactate synthase large subunit-like protein
VISRIDAIRIIGDHVADDDLVISTTGMISREYFVTKDRSGNFYMLGSMGLASSFGLGLALLNPSQKVVVLKGDGSTLMSLGTLALIASEAPPNLLHIILDNESYESTGGQPSITGQIDLAEIAASCGYRHTERVEDAVQLAEALVSAETNRGPRLILVKVEIDSVEDISRVTLTPVEIRNRFHEAVVQTTA